MNTHNDINKIFKLSDRDVDYDERITLIIHYDNLDTMSGQVLADVDLRMIVQYLIPFGEIQGEFPMSRVILFTDNSTLIFTTSRPRPYMSPNYDESLNVFYMNGTPFNALWTDYTKLKSITGEHVPFIDHFKDLIRRGYVVQGN